MLCALVNNLIIINYKHYEWETFFFIFLYAELYAIAITIAIVRSFRVLVLLGAIHIFISCSVGTSLLTVVLSITETKFNIELCFITKL